MLSKEDQAHSLSRTEREEMILPEDLVLVAGDILGLDLVLVDVEDMVAEIVIEEEDQDLDQTLDRIPQSIEDLTEMITKEEEIEVAVGTTEEEVEARIEREEVAAEMIKNLEKVRMWVFDMVV